MKKVVKSFFKIAGIAAKNWWGKDPFMQSAVIAYYAIFTIIRIRLFARDKTYNQLIE
jgi:hypothetical protein